MVIKVIHKDVLKTKLYEELFEDKRKEYFDISNMKFLHQVDTFYYSVLFNNLFMKDTPDMAVNNMRTYLRRELDNCDLFDNIPCEFPDIDVPGKKGYCPEKLPKYFIMRRSNFAGIYNVLISRPGCYDIFIAETVPNPDTSPVVVQIRSYYIWMHGIDRAIQDSFADVEHLAELFGLKIRECKENRVDYCWHTNYIQAPEKFFRLDNIAKMKVSRFKEGEQHFEFVGDNDYEVDYVRFGRLTSNNMLLRFYNKTKEVVEQGYKAFFLRLWLLHGLINRFDLFCYEECYKRRDWKYLDKARLQFYVNNGVDEAVKQYFSSIVDGAVILDADKLRKLADEYVPRCTIITNCEFQTMRKFSSSIKLLPFRPYDGPLRRIWQYLDNRKLIIDYLTHDVFRLVDIKTDKNKSRCGYCNFWKRLRSTRLVDCYVPKRSFNLVREYCNNLDADCVKRTALTAISTFNLYEKGVHNDMIFDDLTDFICCLNDNDLNYMHNAREKKMRQLGNLIKEQPDARYKQIRIKQYTLIDNNTGEVVNQE